MNRYCIIGAGFSGLLTALYLAKKGEEILLLEKNDKVGGLYRTEKAVPIGAHHLGIPNRHEFQNFFEELGIKNLAFVEANTFLLVDRNETFAFSFKVDEQEKILLANFPSEHQAISQFYSYLNRFIDAITNNDQRAQLAFFKETAFISFDNLLSKFKLSNKIKKILVAFGPAYAGVMKDDSAFTYLSVLSTYGKGGYYLSETSPLTTILFKELQKYPNCRFQKGIDHIKVEVVEKYFQVTVDGEKEDISQLILACFPIPLLQQLSQTNASKRLLKELSTLSLSPNVKRFYFEIDDDLFFSHQEYISMGQEYYMISFIKNESRVKYAVVTLIELEKSAFSQKYAEQLLVSVTGIASSHLRRIQADGIADFDEKRSVFGWYRNAKGNLMSNKLLNLNHYVENVHLVGNWASSFGIYGSYFSVRKWIENFEDRK